MKKGNLISFRLDDEEYESICLLAKELNISPSKAARIMMLDGIEELKKTGDEDVLLLSENHDIFQNIQMLSDKLDKKCEQVRQHVDALSFIMLYHTLPVHEDQREEAQRSAWERFPKYKSIARKIDDESAAKRSGTAQSA